MRRKILPPILLLSALTATAFSGCAWLSTTFRTTPAARPITAPPATTPPVAKPPAAKPVTAPPAEMPVTAPPAEMPGAAPPAEKPGALSPADKFFSEGMTALQEGGHERALELFAAAWKEKPDHTGVAREFDGALLALKKNGDAAFTQGKPEDAGKRWMGTLRYIHHPAAKWKAYPFTRSEVKSKVDRLSASLMGKALTEYRRGGVESAIADWKTILSYDPGHEEAAQSLRTATKQLETLKKMPPGK